MSDYNENIDHEADAMEEEFNPELFYRALTNALHQLQHLSAEAEAA